MTLSIWASSSGIYSLLWSEYFSHIMHLPFQQYNKGWGRIGWWILNEVSLRTQFLLPVFFLLRAKAFDPFASVNLNYHGSSNHSFDPFFILNIFENHSITDKRQLRVVNCNFLRSNKQKDGIPICWFGISSGFIRYIFIHSNLSQKVSYSSSYKHNRQSARVSFALENNFQFASAKKLDNLTGMINSILDFLFPLLQVFFFKLDFRLISDFAEVVTFFLDQSWTEKGQCV